MDENGVCAAPDILTGTPAENKALFDRMVRQLVAPAYNACAEAVDAINEERAEMQTEEAGRVAAETGRVTAENARTAAEAARVSAETERIAAAEALQTQWTEAETERAAAEAGRVTAEAGRVSAENAREAAEAARVSAETERIAAAEALEVKRAAAEAGREAAEEARQAAEASRVKREDWSIYSSTQAYEAGNAVSHKGSSYRCKKACQGIEPPNDEYWLLIAARGLDGEGAGDMLEETYDPRGIHKDIFLHEEKKTNPHEVTLDQAWEAQSQQEEGGGGAAAGMLLGFLGNDNLGPVPNGAPASKTVTFSASDWTEENSQWALTITKAQNGRNSGDFVCTVWSQDSAGAYAKNTWAALSADMEYNAENGDCKLVSEEKFAGKIVFAG